MTTKHLYYTTGATLYGSDAEGADSTIQTAITEDVTYSGIYPALTTLPYVYVQLGGAPDPLTDTLLGDVREFYYGSISEGDLFHLKRIHSWDWDNGTTEDKLKALYTATAIIDKFRFVGDKVSSDQLREFPRDRTLSDGTVCQIGDTADVPEQIEDAAYLIADSLIGGRDPDSDFEAQNVKVETFGPVRTEFATNVGPMAHIQNLVPSPTAWAKILPFLRISTSFSVNKG